MNVHTKTATVVVLVGIAAWAVLSGRMPEPTAPAPKASSAGREDTLAALPVWEKTIRARLERTVSVDFRETPLSEALQYFRALAGVNFVLDPRAFDYGGDREMPVTLKLKDIPLKWALRWTLTLCELDYQLRGESIFISSPYNLAGEVYLEIYDIHELGNGDRIAVLLQTRVHPDSWARELGTSIEHRDGRLVVLQRPAVQARIRLLLHALRVLRQPPVRVDVRLLEVRELVLTGIRPKARATLTRGQLRRLGASARELGSALIICKGGDRGELLMSSPKSIRDFIAVGAVAKLGSRRKIVDVHISLRWTARVEGSEGADSSWDFVAPITVRCKSGATVLAASAMLPGRPEPTRLIVLVTPTIVDQKW